ncbi:DoxX family protein [Mucilaginibacter terrenus]|uniref:DoxX family protein n=1 Tax=Mucilaginibacter terrenus TaxID=2482727 RepID=A0A3E2NRI9_9SPHI|nr:DoxX family protein [Mucilaginibacter terrenus]RFZ83551.1 DoxX family protein [Mucilaginibacter terrenus]
MKIFKKISVVILVIFYFIAGLNHFRSPESYIRIIPGYLPYPAVLNIAAGIAEIVFALLAIRPQSRKVACYGIILMLLAFLPVHIQMVKDAPLQLGSLTVTPTIAWIRLVLLQPFLILWAWWHSLPNKPATQSASR